MKFKISVFLILLVLAMKVSGQKDAEALRILDKFSSTALNAPSVSMNFDFVTNDQAEKTTDTLSGFIVIDGDKYKLEIPNNTIWFNGEISWSYLTAEKEVTITKPGKSEDEFQSKPSSVFTMYKKGYKVRLLDDKGSSYTIDLYPEDLKSNLVHVRLSINKTSMVLNTLEYKQKDGIVRTLYMKNYDLKKKTESSFFFYPKDQFKGVEIIDMR